MSHVYIRGAKIRLADGETPVNPHLSMTPQQMAERTVRGQSIAAQAQVDNAYFDNSASAEDLPMMFQRGVDQNTLWEHAARTKRKLRDFSKQQMAKIKKAQRDPALN